MVFKKKNHPKSGQIRVTHYVSPHEFWIKYNDVNDTLETKLQQSINRLGHAASNNYNYSPIVGEYVIVHYCFGTVNKLIRARVDCELKNSTGSEFILWAIDEGYPIQSGKKWITQLTADNLKNEVSSVYKVTINDVVPATTQFNVVQATSEIVKSKCWSDKAINQFGILTAAPSMIFHYDCHAAAQHLFGSIELISPTGKSVNASDVLKSLNEAVAATDFEIEYQNLVRNSYWLQQQEHFKIKENGKGAGRPMDIKPLSPISAVKVNDYKNRSDLLSQHENSLQKIPHNKRFQLLMSTSGRSGHKSSPSCMKSTNPTSGDNCSSLSMHKSNVNALPNFKNAYLQNTGIFQNLKERGLLHIPDGLYVSSIVRISDANFNDKVLNNLEILSMKKVYRIQAAAWPHLMRCYSLILISGSKTGKTSTYLPAVCSLLMETHSDGLITEGDGPVMIIICRDSSGAKCVVERCRFLMSNQFSCEAAYDQQGNDLEKKLLKNCEILVTTVPCLLNLMTNPLNFGNKKRITTIVFDDIDSMCDRFSECEVEKIYKTFCFNSAIQTIVTSKTWHNLLRKFSLKDDVLIYINESIEAAFYSKVTLTVQPKDQNDPYGQFLSVIKKINFDERIVVWCRDYEEVVQIKDIVKINCNSDVECYSKEEDIKNYGQFKLPIVCTDDALDHLLIRNAQHIIHFSLPKKLNTFKQRFVVSMDYYRNLVFDGLKAPAPTSIVFVDGNSDDLSPKLIQFLQLRCSADDLDQFLRIDKAENELITRVERVQPATNRTLGNKLNNSSKLQERPNTYHQYISSSERISRNTRCSREVWETLEPNAFHEIDIGYFYSPTRFYVLLVSKFESFQLLKQGIHDLTISKNVKPLTKVTVGEICLATLNNNGYVRAKIIQVDRTTVDIFYVDYGIEEHKVALKNLIQIPDSFIENLPFQAILCKMTGIRPSNNSDKWTADYCNIIEKILKDIPQIFVRSTGKHSVSSDIIKCNAYDVAYLDKMLQRNINRLIVRKGFAEFDPQTKHLLDVSVDWNSLDDEWNDDDRKNAAELDLNVNGRYVKGFYEDPADEWLDFPKLSKEKEFDGNRVQTSLKSAEGLNEVPALKETEICSVTLQLVKLNKPPKIIWEQTAELISMFISGIDVKNYSLKVGQRYIKLSNDSLALYESVIYKYTSIENLGDFIIVRLKKATPAIHWPQLVRSQDEGRFVVYKMDECGDAMMKLLRDAATASHEC